jgi:hypothetical protein
MKGLATVDKTTGITGTARRTIDGPIIADMAKTLAGQYGTAAILCALADARHAAEVLAEQALGYAIDPGPAEALADVLAMLGFTAPAEAGPIRFGSPA